eukprot:6821776-Prymnesium_polylepis.1
MIQGAGAILGLDAAVEGNKPDVMAEHCEPKVAPALRRLHGPIPTAVEVPPARQRINANADLVSD